MNFNFRKAAGAEKVKNGSKISTSLVPELICLRAMHRIRLNDKAAQLLGITNGDRFEIHVIDDADSVNQKYIITPSADGRGPVATAAGKSTNKNASLTASYAPVYSQMVQDDPKAQPCQERDLVKAGIMRETYTQSDKDGKHHFRNLAGQYVSFTLVPITDDNDQPTPVTIEGTTYETAFGLVNRTVEKLSGKELQKWNMDVEAIKAGTLVPDVEEDESEEEGNEIDLD